MVCMDSIYLSGRRYFYFILRFKSNQLQKQYDEDKIKFFIDTAHDIRTPVTLIMAPLEDLGKQQELSVDAHQLLDMARNNTRKLHTLITQLLEFEKVDTHKKSITLEPVNLSELLVEECASFQALCDKNSCICIFHYQIRMYMPWQTDI